MKFLITLLFVMPICAFAQDCSFKKVKDQFSQEPKITSGFVPFNSSKLNIEADAKEIHFLFVLGNTGEMKCFEDGSTLQIAFEGTNTKAFLRNTGSMNCDGYFDVSFKNTPTTTSYLNRMTTHKIKSLVFTGNNKAVTTITLSDDQKELFKQLATCIATESKTLIK
ncbi:MAG: hypothetical protein EOO43_15565 [Flavobacterium sp.]|nr:MAG: hypothetical protein EOO43_15565 [Flavobacterium sp.]